MNAVKLRPSPEVAPGRGAFRRAKGLKWLDDTRQFREAGDPPPPHAEGAILTAFVASLPLAADRFRAEPPRKKSPGFLKDEHTTNIVSDQ